MPVVKAGDVLTCVLSRGYCICLDMKVGHSLLTCMLVCIAPSVVSSVVLVSIENGTRVIVRVFCLYPINPSRLSNQCRTSADRCTPTLPRWLLE